MADERAFLRILQQKEPGAYDHVELASLNSVSKGMVGECGHRAGYFELVGWDPEVQAQIYKLVSSDGRHPVAPLLLHRDARGV